MEMKECSESASQQGSRHAAASALEQDIRSPTSRAKRKRFAREIKEGDITLLDIQGLRTTEKRPQDIIAIANVLNAAHSYGGIKLLADITDAEEAGVLDCFMAAKTGSTANALGL